jgi:hypothetical protein
MGLSMDCTQGTRRQALTARGMQGGAPALPVTAGGEPEPEPEAQISGPEQLEQAVNGICRDHPGIGIKALVSEVKRRKGDRTAHAAAWLAPCPRARPDSQLLQALKG